MTEETQPHIAEQLYNQSWEDLEVLEHNDRLLFPSKIYKRNKDGSIKGIDVLLQAPREADFRKARVLARNACLKEKLDLDRDKNLIEQYETTCLLHLCIRNPSSPYEPLAYNPEELEQQYEMTSLESAYDKICRVRDLSDPRPSELSEMDCWTLVTAIATARNALPLTAYAPDSQSIFMLFMVDQLFNSPAYRSFLESQEVSMQEQSPSSDSIEP